MDNNKWLEAYGYGPSKTIDYKIVNKMFINLTPNPNAKNYKK